MQTLSIGSVSLGGVPRIVVPLYDDDPEGDVAAVRGLADLIELRIDCFSRVEPAHVTGVVGRVRDAGPLPVIATVRWTEEGGRAPLSDGDRLALYRAVAPLSGALDVELRSPIRDEVLELCRARGCTSIVSSHSFDRMPAFDELEYLVDQADDCRASILKIAAAAHSMAEVRQLLEFTLRHRDRGLVTIALGEVGAISRVFFPLAGSLFTFAHHRTPSGPGQLPLAQMRAALELYYPRP